MVFDQAGSDPLLGPSTSSLLAAVTSRKGKSFLAFLVLAFGVLFFLVYSTILIVHDAVAGNYLWVDVEKPNNDPKIYKYLPELVPNAPPIVVVQDPGAQLTGFAVGVSAGAYYDPVDFPGLAHFTEHMLFLGTEKFPGPTSFDEFISSHGGSSNAFTDSERTVYYNAIDTDAFQEGFGRFIEFFTRPAFNSTYIGKEVNAVDSEHDMHINDVAWRMFSLVGSLSLPPANHYSTGDSSTLLGEGGVAALAKAVRQYYSANYCFNRLSIAVVSPMPVSDQIEMVRDVFASISAPIARNCKQPTNFSKTSKEIVASNNRPLPASALNRIVYSEGPAGSVPAVWLAFPFAPVVTRGQGGKHPFGIIETVLSYNGEESLKRKLIAEGLITAMTYMSDDTSAGAIGYVAFDIAPGARDRIPELVNTTFAFLEKIRSTGGVPTPLIAQLQQVRDSLFYSNAESHSIANEPPMRLAKYLASELVTATRVRANVATAGETLISGNERILEIDSKLVNEVLASMTEANSVVLVHDPGYASPPAWVKERSNGNWSDEKTDPHYGFRFKSSSGGFVDTPNSGSDAIDMEKVTVLRSLAVVPPVIAKRATTGGETRVNMSLVMSSPELIEQSSTAEVWYKPSAMSAHLPKVWMWATVRPAASSVNSMTPEELQFNGEMIVDCVTYELRAQTADFLLAGYDFVINWMTPGYFELKVFGWNDHAKSLLDRVLGELSRPKLKYFDLILREKTDALTRPRTLSEITGESANALLLGSPTREDMRSYINTFPPTKQGTLEWVSRVFKSTHVSAYVGGAPEIVSRANATAFTEIVSRAFGGNGLNKTLAASHLAGPRYAKPVEVRITNPVANDPNSALLYTLSYGSDMSAKDRVVAALLSSVVDPLVFRTIRTEHQMGYIASARIGIYPSPAGSVQMRVYIQGNVADPDLMEARVEVLLSTIGEKLGQLSIAEIQQRAGGLGASLEELPNSANVEISQFWSAIHDNSGCFGRGGAQAAFLKSADPTALRNDMVNVFNEFWNQRRSKLVVKVWKSEEGRIQVPAWDVKPLLTTLASDKVVMDSLASEKAKTVFVTSTGKKDREHIFATAVDSRDPMWDPVIPACDI